MKGVSKNARKMEGDLYGGCKNDKGKSLTFHFTLGSKHHRQLHIYKGAHDLMSRFA